MGGFVRQLRFARQRLPGRVLGGAAQRELRLGPERRHTPSPGVLGGKGVVGRDGVVEATRLLLAGTEHERSAHIAGCERLRGRRYDHGRIAPPRRGELGREAEAIPWGRGRDRPRPGRPRARADHDHAQHA